MNKKIQEKLDFFIRDKKHHAYRQPPPENIYILAERFASEKKKDTWRSLERLRWMLENEKPVVFANDRIAMIRTVPVIPEIFTEQEMEEIRKEHYIHEQGKICNVNPDYINVIRIGFEGLRQRIAEAREHAGQEEREYLDILKETLTVIAAFADRYRIAAEEAGNQEIADIFSKIPRKGAETFQEALQFFRLMHYCLWCSFNYHNTIGRFDQYMYGYWEHDLKNGELNQDEALELLEEFFISFNKDSDLYTGMQQGDNGQSMILGGKNREGQDCFNDLSEQCLKACLELKLIDPKINVRVHKDTSLELYEKCTQLTKQGLGFPQYSNDEVVIPALIDWGYDEDDAYNYVVAACWEFIIPGVGMDIPNIDGLSFAEAVSESMELLPEAQSMSEIEAEVRRKINEKIHSMLLKYRSVYMEPSPVMSMLMTGCIERGKDASLGLKYNNYGIHGTGLSTAVDSLSAIEKYVFEEKRVTAQEMFQALKADFKGYEELRNMLRYETPKMGDNDERTDRFAVELLDWFADSLVGCRNDRGGIFRAGTGSAMYYVWHSEGLGATPDGREAGEAFACNYSPSLFARCEGPLSIIESFSKPHLTRVANGGPLTIELYDQLFRNEESIRKVAMFVKAFMDMGGHQMQINAVNREKLLDAKAHPENYRNLIVRVWGWSGYFVELDEVYQDHIIKRVELMME